MANRLEFNPALMPCPDFMDEFYAALHNSLIIDPNHAGINNNQEAANHLKEQWEVVNTWLLLADQEEANQRREEAEELQKQRESEDRERLSVGYHKKRWRYSGWCRGWVKKPLSWLKCKAAGLNANRRKQLQV
ncbi:hypothetical protein GGU10DRAFT_337375 [Lentinula aff. detonsa]|uniref:Uncharacterized protein n=1 Tax=Lentinula aff. detonsa TaxID=2804958 RepID=A0AA38L2K4_9AGAR|nr:hypothetical protein GGU10DRAFT_337375 [Lentinula aff. detonsa]